MKISAVIPTFNRASFIEVAIQSVLRQTLPVSELIVVDDGSTDSTEDLVRRLSADDPRIIFIKQERGGANRARNAGSKVATGDWIAFLDSDDAWEENKLSLQMAALAANPGAVASFTGFRGFGVHTKKIYLPPSDPSLFEIRSANVLSTTSTAVINKTVFWQVGGFDPSLPSCQDWDLWFRLRQKGHFAVVRKPLVRYNTGPHERITSNFQLVIEGHQQVFQRLRVGIEHDRHASRRISAKHKLVLTEVYLRSGDPRTAASQCMSSLLISPSKRGARLLATSARDMIATLLQR